MTIVDIAGQTIDVAPEPGTVGEEPVEPSDAMAYCLHRKAYVEHGKHIEMYIRFESMIYILRLFVNYLYSCPSIINT